MEEKIELNNLEEEDYGAVFDLEDNDDRDKLGKELISNSMYFRPEVDVTYKISLTSSKVPQVEKEFNGEQITKYVLCIRAQKKDGAVFEGLWEVGKSVLEPIFKHYEKDAVFKITKTGSGKETRYSVVADF